MILKPCKDEKLYTMLLHSTHVLVIAYGNPLRSDDGTGLALAERLVQYWQSCRIVVEQIVLQQLVPEVAADIADTSVTHIVFCGHSNGDRCC